MRFEYVFLIWLSILPIIYKLAYWQISMKETDYKIFSTKQGRERLFHFWFFLELPFFLLAFVPFIQDAFEILLYGLFFYFLILYNIFVVWKIVRKKINFPVINWQSVCIVLILLSQWLLLYFYPMCIYAALGWSFVLMPIYFLMTQKLSASKDTDQEDHSER